jgi:hypothetical protein
MNKIDLITIKILYKILFQSRNFVLLYYLLTKIFKNKKLKLTNIQESQKKKKLIQ